MKPLRKTPPPQFAERVATEDIQLRGLHARAMQFADGCRDTSRAVVCVAGMGADGRSFVRQRSLGRDWFVLMLNLPHETPDAVDPLDFAASAVEQYLDHERLERPVLLGSSFGGAVAAEVALRRPDRIRAVVFAGAVLSSWQIPLASFRFIDVLEAPAPIAALFAPMAVQLMGGFALDRDGRDEIIREARHFSGRELKRRLATLLELDLVPRLKTLELPLLFLHGSRDLFVPIRRAKSIAAELKSAELVEIKGAGHLPYLTHPEEFNAEVSRFLASRTELTSGLTEQRHAVTT